MHIPAEIINHDKSGRENIDLSIVVPVYKSESILNTLIVSIEVEMHKADLFDRFELILVNDASPDNSWAVIRALATKYAFINGISLRKNFGQHNATMAGIKCCSGRLIVIMDDDLQHPPSAIADMISTLNDGYDVCYTNYNNRQHQLWKKIGSYFNDKIASILLEKPKGLYLSSFKALKKEVATEILKYDGPFPYIDGLILDVTDAITSINIEHQSRAYGQGNYTLYKSISLWLKMATGFSVLPLRFASVSGLFLSAISFLMIAIVILNKFTHPELPVGWPSSISVILFIGGIQLFCIGLIGEYLARSYLKINHKPQFIIKDQIGG